MNYPTVSSEDELLKAINNSSSCPDVAPDEVARLVQLAQQRADLRDADSAMEVESPDAIIATDWTGFASNEFDYDNGHVNQFAMGELQRKTSAEKDATLFRNAVVIQNGWLQTGDGRRNQVVEYEDEEFSKADPGEFWVPKAAQDYITIIELEPAFVHGQPGLEDAM